MTPLLQRLYHLPLVGWVLRHRFPRFAVVGASGTVVNLVVLYLGQEFLFRAIEPEGTRLNFSLSLAVFVATLWFNFVGINYFSSTSQHSYAAPATDAQVAVSSPGR